MDKIPHSNSRGSSSLIHVYQKSRASNDNKNFEINLSLDAWGKCRGQIYKQFLLFQWKSFTFPKYFAHIEFAK